MHPLNKTAPGSPEEDKILGAFIRRQEREALKERYGAKLEREHGVTRPLTRRVAILRRLYRPLGIAAAVLLLIAAAFQVLSPQQTSTQDLIAAELEVQGFRPPVNRSLNTEVATDTDAQILIEFGAGNYDGVISLGGAELNTTSQFYLGLSLLASQRPAEAIDVLQAIPESSSYHPHAEWYTALLHLNHGELETGRAMLESYTPEDIVYYRKAQTILRSIKD